MSALNSTDAELVARYNAGVALVESALAGATDEDLDRRSDGWSARMVVHHLADSETNSYLRLRRLLAEPTPTQLQGYDEARWAATPTLGYETLPIASSLSVFRAVRAASGQLLTRINAEDLEIAGEHTESGRYTLRDWLRIYAEHAEEHAAQITRARAGVREGAA